MDSSNPYAPPKADVSLPVTPNVAPLASRGSRLAAALIDGIIIAIISGLLSALFSEAVRHSTSFALQIRMSDPTRFGSEMLWVAVNAWLLHTRGQTLGKMMVGIRIVRRDGLPTTFWHLLGRRYAVTWGLGFAMWGTAYFFPARFEIVKNIVALIYFTDILLIFRPNKACLHDDLAGTKVIPAQAGYRPAQNWND